MDKLSVILDGWKNYIFPSIAIKQMAEERAAICAPCEFSVETLLHLPDKTPIKNLKCTMCGCPSLSAVVRAVDKTCPIGKW